MKKNTQNDYMIQYLVIITRNVKITKNSKILHIFLAKFCYDRKIIKISSVKKVEVTIC